jgi:glycosyltransferase involved in cell wall biosynthesis
MDNKQAVVSDPLAQPLRIVVHDYSGHPGQAQLSRALARRGHVVIHQHCPSYSTGKGSLETTVGDPPSLTFEQCSLGADFKRYSVLQRPLQEIRYGLIASRAISAHKPDVVVLSNVPLLAHALVARRLSRRKIPMVFWHQDIYSVAIGSAARKRLPRAGGIVAGIAEMTERSIARSSAAIVAISSTFLEKLGAWGVSEKTAVIPNWAPLDEIPVHPRNNTWRAAIGIGDAPMVLYSGTLGLKHDPSILGLVASALEAERPDARLVVVSEGRGREWLEQWKREHRAKNLVLLDYQPYRDLPLMLASADVLVAILEPDASKYSVPSKVLTYLCAERPIVGVLPLDNSVAEILIGQQAGVVIDPGQRDAVAAAILGLLQDENLRQNLGKAGRSYAEAEFSPERAASRFESVFGRIFPQRVGS